MKNLNLEDFQIFNQMTDMNQIRKLQAVNAKFDQFNKYIVTGCKFIKNNASAQAAGATGAGILFHYQEGTVTDCQFIENYSNDVGAGIVVRETYVKIMNN